MRIQPRRQILDIWRSVIRASFKDGKWIWGGRDEPNSISDAEQVLCLLYPATELANLALDRPDAMADDVAAALEPLGGPATVPQRVIDVLTEYIERYTDDQGEPTFAGGSYLRLGENDGPDAAGSVRVTEEQRRLGVVDSYSMSVTLCLATLGFLSVFRPLARRPALVQKIEQLEQAVNDRLTAAMVGLLRSFVVNTVLPSDPERAVMLRMVNQTRAPEQVVLANLRTRLTRVRARLRDDVRLGIDVEVGLAEEERLFECGWGWGIVRNSAQLTIDLEQTGFSTQPKICFEAGVADPRPYLYSTVVALDGINDLRSTRTRELGLLNDDQRRLSEALQLRWDMTQRYWSIIARFGDSTWPLEDIPWQTSDGEESDYYSLLVSSVLVQDMENREATDDDLNRAVAVFESLAQRGRITRRVMVNDVAVNLHVPGVQMRLGGTADLGPQLFWRVADFAPLLLKRTLQAARLSGNVGAREELMRLAEATMDHLSRRRISYGDGEGLWDDPGEVLFPNEDRKPMDLPSWYLTERVVEGLVAAARTFDEAPVRSTAVINRAQELLHEADHLLNREMLQDADVDDGSARRDELTSIEATLARARRILIQQPGTANALAMDALRRLDEMAVAHLDATRGI
ncbi:MAG TPA: SCO2524 family protein [Actinophytocola sp.]|uniref:SCO2524 family protein n=1 Tax=Actinophytocola sp. TaxID=1872138 RepID=UPI002DBAD312|nr:SCO2524 family protein [Actinophytocola sp.]HEU5469558.1 SCO2524 family protein [Actinophytocola sp.]